MYFPDTAKPLRAINTPKLTRAYKLPDIDDDTILTTNKNVNNEHSDGDATKPISGNDKQTKLRQNRDQESEDDDIQSKEETDDEDDVQLIIIPKKQHKKLQGLPESKDRDSGDSDSGESDSGDSDSGESDSGESDSGESDSGDSDSGDSDSGDSSDEIKEQFKRLEKKLVKKITESKEKEVEDGNSISLERVSQGKKAGTGDYDLHVNLKDNAGTKVKLSGDLPGNLGNLVAEGDGGGKVQVGDTKHKENEPAPTKSEDSSVTEDDIADSVIKTRQGKHAHAPYSSGVLFKPSTEDVQDPDGTLAQNNRAKDTAMGQQLSVLKNDDQDRYLSHEVSKATLTPSSLATKDDPNRKMTNQQPDNNVFSEMQLDDADDELVATSRLLDIARKADDDSALKDGKESQSIKPQRILANSE